VDRYRHLPHRSPRRPKRLRDVCHLPENEKQWIAGKGFVVRDLPWTIDKLKAIPPFEFENWAVIALGAGCYVFNSDCDEDLDLLDYAGFPTRLTGP
jgi:hypothetical protein